MKRVLQLEELLLFGGGILLFAQLPFTWWGFQYTHLGEIGKNAKRHA